MSEYTPSSRRPIGNAFRKTANSSVQLCVRLNIHPDVISYLSIVASAFAGLCFWKSGSYINLLILGPFFCYLRLWFNMLDGMVALASGKSSLRGEILNDLPDRISDVLIFIGVAHSQLVNPYAGYLTAIFALLVAYVGMMGQAVGVQREFSGLMSKPWRMVVLHIGSWITLGFIWWNEANIVFRGLTILDWTLLVIIIGCIQTIWLRLSKIIKALRSKE